MGQLYRVALVGLHALVVSIFIPGSFGLNKDIVILTNRPICPIRSGGSDGPNWPYFTGYSLSFTARSQ